MYVAGFRIIPVFLDGLAAVLLTASIVLGTNYISPVCMLIFNGDIRQGAKKIFLSKKDSTKAIASSRMQRSIQSK